MSELPKKLDYYQDSTEVDIETVVNELSSLVQAAGYDIVESNSSKPWGAYLRIQNEQADAFVEDFFEGLSPQEARLGVDDAELSPKLLVVLPSSRLSLQKHARRAERWRFLTDGYYYKSSTDDAGEMKKAKKGEVVQFLKGETHRLCGKDNGLVLVAEIWQHTDPDNPSDEDDIVRLEDDYIR